MICNVTVDRIEEGIAVMMNEDDQSEIQVALNAIRSFSIAPGDMLTVSIDDHGAIQILGHRSEAQQLRRDRIKTKQKKLAGRKSGSRFKK